MFIMAKKFCPESLGDPSGISGEKYHGSTTTWHSVAAETNHTTPCFLPSQEVIEPHPFFRVLSALLVPELGEDGGTTG